LDRGGDSKISSAVTASTPTSAPASNRASRPDLEDCADAALETAA